MLSLLKAVITAINVFTERIIEYANAYSTLKRKGGVVDYPARIIKKSSFEGYNRIGKRSSFHGTMGFGSYISADCAISADIGRFTCIANQVETITGTHPYKAPFVSISPMFYTPRNQVGNSFAKESVFNEMRYVDCERKIGVKLGNDCWIGERVLIIGGVTIEDGAVVLAGAVVTKDVPPYAIVGGVPAKVLKYRYDDETINLLLNFKWWNKDKKWLKQNWEIFCDIEKLKSLIHDNSREQDSCVV